MRKGCGIVIIGLSLLWANCWAATYHVNSSTGDDSYDGLSATVDGGGVGPWKTAARTLPNWGGGGTTVVAGDTVKFASGSYGDWDMAFDPDSYDKATTWDTPFYFCAEDGATPVFTQIFFNDDGGSWSTARYYDFTGLSVIRSIEDYDDTQPCVEIKRAFSLRFHSCTITGSGSCAIYQPTVSSHGFKIYGVAYTDPMSDILIENCEISYVATGIQVYLCDLQDSPANPIEITGNYLHHTTNSAINVDGTNDPANETHATVLIKRNHIYREQSIPQYMHITAASADDITGTFSDGEKIHNTDGAIAKFHHMYSSDPTKTIQMYPSGDIEWVVGAGKTITGETSGATMANPSSISYIDYSHASAIACRIPYVLIDSNIIHCYGGTNPVRLYPDEYDIPTGYHDVVIQNNLLYDSVAAHSLSLEDVGGLNGVWDCNIQVINNTLIGTHTDGTTNYYFDIGLKLRAQGDYSTINDAVIDSLCGEESGHTLTKVFNTSQTGDYWEHDTEETHWFILDWGKSINVTKVEGRSNTDCDPTNVNIYVSDDKENWGDAVASNISTWQDTDSWVEIDTTDKVGRYLKVEITATEDASSILKFGLDSNSQIFKAYLVADGTGLVMYNNLVAGYGYVYTGLTGYTEDYNRFYSFSDGGWQGTEDMGAHTIIDSDSGEQNTDDFLNNMFVSPIYGRGDDETHYTDGGPTFETGDFTLQSGSPARSAGSSTYQPSNSLGTLSGGFIQNNGVTRNSANYDIGAYVYGVGLSYWLSLR